MITIYHCETCNTNFEIPMELTNMYNISEIACPICKSHNWKRIAMLIKQSLEFLFTIS
jgi:DNA-directed RNA polymerase subunit RPC12/RpoP